MGKALYIFSSLAHSLLPKDNLLKNIFDFTTAGDRDYYICGGPALHYSIDFTCLSFGIMATIVEL